MEFDDNKNTQNHLSQISQPVKKKRKIGENSKNETSISNVKQSEISFEEDKTIIEDNDTLSVQSEISFEEDKTIIEDNDTLSVDSDPHVLHFNYELPQEPLNEEILLNSKEEKEIKWPKMGKFTYVTYKNLKKEDQFSLQPKTSIANYYLKKNLKESDEVKKIFASTQSALLPFEFYSIISEYKDLLFMKQTYESSKELSKVYILHILNHILKSRAKIIHHNSKLLKNPNEEFRDQGFTRPSVFILVPFRNDCYRIVNIISAFLPECAIMNKKRFETEFSPPPPVQRIKKKPKDFGETFFGNIDEDFQIGICIKNKSIQLYSDFYKSDLIIASPLGIRLKVGAFGQTANDIDFLSSIEILVIDKADCLFLQNQPQLFHVLQHFNHLPKDGHGCNFFRVRMYALDGMAKFYRQTILLSSVEHPWFQNCLFSKFCFNHEGYICSWSDVYTPAISQVFIPMKMCFRWFEFDSPINEMDFRFNFFTTKVLKHYTSDFMSQTLIYIPSYFDFVRLRNYFRCSELSCVMVCEYSKKGKIAQARDLFYKGHRHFMLYTERTHFYSRYNIKGIQHIIFYQLPTYPLFFRELCNLLVDSHPRRKLEEKTCCVLVSKLDCLQLKHIVGMKEAKRMFNSKEDTFVNYVDFYKK